jgi:hypothetical protein
LGRRTAPDSSFLGSSWCFCIDFKKEEYKMPWEGKLITSPQHMNSIHKTGDILSDAAHF